MKQKRCTKCGETKSLDKFYKCWKTRDGYQWQCKECHKVYRKTHKGKSVQKRYTQTPKGKKVNKRKKLKHNYGITLADYDKMYEEQNGVCAICGGTNLNGQRLCIDHNHITKKVRGLLCIGCNHKLSIVEDKEFLEKANNYLKSNS